MRSIGRVGVCEAATNAASRVGAPHQTPPPDRFAVCPPHEGEGRDPAFAGESGLGDGQARIDAPESSTPAVGGE